MPNFNTTINGMSNLLAIQDKYAGWQDTLSTAIHDQLGTPLQEALSPLQGIDEKTVDQEAIAQQVQELTRQWFNDFTGLFKTYEKEYTAVIQNESGGYAVHAYAREVLEQLGKLFKHQDTNPGKVVLISDQSHRELELHLRVMTLSETLTLTNQALEDGTKAMLAMGEDFARLATETQEIAKLNEALTKQREELREQELDKTLNELTTGFKEVNDELKAKTEALGERVESLEEHLQAANGQLAQSQLALQQKQAQLTEAQNNVRVEVRETIRYVKKIVREPIWETVGHWFGL